MSIIVYHKRGLDLRDTVVLQNSDGTFVTGLVDGDFTKRLSKDGVGNQSVTGITLTEVSAANNPGEYTVFVPASSFAGTNGVYVLTVVRTSDPLFGYAQPYVVNDDGTPSSTPASFTATLGDGRVTDGANPVQGATVYLTLGSTFISQATTDASGLWGPIYLVDGTYTVRVQRAGYQQSTATITVSGLTVTGPGADIALAAGSTVDPMSAAQLWSYARRMAADLTGTKADAIIKGAVNDALDMMTTERLWPHMLRKGTLALRGPYTTGTIAVTNGSADVVLTGGTWPAWAASGKLFFGGQILDVYARTDNTTLTLAVAWEAASVTGQSFILYQNEYELPENLWKFHRPLPGQRWGWGGEPADIASIIEAEHAAVYGQNFPSRFAIATGAFVCCPYPSQDAVLSYTYYARPARLSFDTDVADVDSTHVELLKRAIDYQLARVLGKVLAGDAATTLAAYKEAMGRFRDSDKSPVDMPAVGHDYRVAPSRSQDWKRIQ